MYNTYNYLEYIVRAFVCVCARKQRPYDAHALNNNV